METHLEANLRRCCFMLVNGFLNNLITILACKFKLALTCHMITQAQGHVQLHLRFLPICYPAQIATKVRPFILTYYKTKRERKGKEMKKQFRLRIMLPLVWIMVLLHFQAGLRLHIILKWVVQDFRAPSKTIAFF